MKQKLIVLFSLFVFIISCTETKKVEEGRGGCTVCTCMAFAPDPENPAICIRSKPNGTGVCRHSKGLHVRDVSNDKNVDSTKIPK